MAEMWSINALTLESNQQRAHARDRKSAFRVYARSYGGLFRTHFTLLPLLHKTTIFCVKVRLNLKNIFSHNQMAFALRTPFRSMATVARQSLKIGLVPADGIGREVIPVCSIRCSSYII